LVEEIGGNRELTDVLVNLLLEKGRTFDSSEMAPVAIALSRLVPLSRHLDDWCSQMVRGIGNSARLALAIRAAQWQDDAGYFGEMENREADDLLAAEMSARLWSRNGGKALCTRLVVLSDRRYSGIEDVWSYWCERQESESLLDMVEQLIEQSEQDANHERVYGLLAGSGLGKAVQRRPRPSLGRIDELRDEIGNLARAGKNSMAKELAKWVAYNYCPDLVDKEVEWAVDPKGRFALPGDPNEPLLLREIFARIRAARPRFDLPSSAELSKFTNPIEGKRELVRDGFPKGYDFEERIMPVNICTWDGKNLGHFTRGEVESLRVKWRPKFNL
jgi:hypothetical protein